ncbi:hypothetical protein GCM10025857_11270 [Alicyclobacillus contaminans]|nr:hypothetical protein GCM10025857_11270 [Alicyclobacillus contaminans]
MVVELILMYLGKKPSVVVDLGCGTGLSTFVWKDVASRVIGVEPNDDMRRQAEENLTAKTDIHNLSFVRGFANQLDLESESVDVVTCSQSFHWMEPVSTLREVSRVLRSGGIFAAYDCDWPPSVNWKVEEHYVQLIHQADALIHDRIPSDMTAKKWPKDEHLRQMQESRSFRFTKEVVFHVTDSCDAERYVGLALSQGSLQTVLRSGWTELDNSIETFKDIVKSHFQDQVLNVVFSYRMRFGIK